jgi:type I restriction enzyme M protein
MLDSETKRRIDNARNILVGKVPDPKSQVEQITIALIYKFMDDMDASSEELGGKRTFFEGEFARYGWAKLMRSGLGGHETLNLYAEAIAKMPENPGIPLLFREIFKNAYLPYRDPETLRAFLKIIDDFHYDHSEKLGDAFEYLLSVLGSQGDAGQFRTPRHIIDFMVAVVDPKKTDVVLDPACGTAGFLVSSYKHILGASTDAKGNSKLTPDEKARLAQNFKGYDISPDMVRLSLVNLYLHGFADPHIAEYDALTSQDKWNEYADVILANPPFMSPKGGIKPHNRFSVQSKRSEVLFVDYMAEHLTPNGRAGIIVPEGIIFQSQTAYKQLRKLLVEEYLVAVVSLPSGVFNPYSGVKTSILILDKSLAKRASTIAFLKIENDGFGLGAQRRETTKNDLPQARAEIGEYLQSLRAGESVEVMQSTLGLIVTKQKIAADENYNLSAERYREGGASTSRWPMVPLGTVVEIESGSRQKGGAIESGIPSIGGEQIDSRGNIRFNKMKYISEEHFRGMTKGVLRSGDVLIVKDGATTGKTGFFINDIPSAVNEHVFILRAKEAIHPYYLYWTVRAEAFQGKLRPFIKGIIGGISLEFSSITVPLPALEVQRKIAAEIEGCQKVIDGARAVLDSYRPHIPIHPAWPLVELSEICSFKNGLNFDKVSAGHTVKIIGVSDFQANLYAPLRGLDEVHLNSPLVL